MAKTEPKQKKLNYKKYEQQRSPKRNPHHTWIL